MSSLFRHKAAFFILVVFVLGLIPIESALADKRVALVIGNGAYKNVSELPNPSNDSSAIADVLRKAGFEVVDSRQDLSVAEMKRVLRDFSDKVLDADVALVFYAGHGIEIDGTNYLVPIDAKLERDVDVEDEALPLDRVLRSIDPAKKLRLVILDACRDNPLTRTMKRSVSSRGISRGLAKVEPTNPNTLVAYAAKAGSTAADGAGAHSPFTAALLRQLAVPGQDVRRTLGYVRDAVLKETGNKQEPFVYGSLGGDDVVLVPAPKLVTPAPAEASPLSSARRDYELALQMDMKEVWGSYLSQYPSGFYSELAKGHLRKIEAEEARIQATQKAGDAKREAELATKGARERQKPDISARARETEKARIEAENAKSKLDARIATAELTKVEVQKQATSLVSNQAGRLRPSPDDRKVALVIGNSAYKFVTPLAKPLADAALIASTLRELGFQTVLLRTDLDKAAMDSALREFRDVAARSDWALLYYAGHGIEISGFNRLFAIDGNPTSAADMFSQSIGLEKLVEAVQPAKKLKLVVLDSGRDSPFSPGTLVTADVKRANIEKFISDGALIFYSTKEGDVARDGNEDVSPFAKAFASNARTPKIDIASLFEIVRKTVLTQTKNEQEPSSYGVFPAEKYYLSNR